MPTNMNHFAYVGSELQVFSQAVRWKKYYRKLIDDFIGREVLEVGAGIGATTESLCKGRMCDRWVCPGAGRRVRFHNRRP